MSEFLTASQAAKKLGTSLTNVARWCRDGTLPAARLGIGRIWQIKSEDVDHFTPPARGPKPVGERKRLLEMAKEVVRLTGLAELDAEGETIQYQFDVFTVSLAQQAHCTRARARQALAKAIRLARGEQIKASHLARLDRVIDNLRSTGDSDGNDEDPALRPDQP